MRLIRLKLKHFAGLASGHVEFGPGLNVLYGPNELGKSTMAEAIRAALLLPCSSRMHEQWVRWNTDKAPFVQLVFQTEPQRFWRVEKSFGSGAKSNATLDESKDGVNFSNFAKARRVDGEIRKLLNWGIPEPGGAGSVKGLPQTFLTTVLLPHQDNVTDVFSRDLGSDYDESGKQMLRDALEAMATDPLFNAVLSQAQAKVDEAFTARGNRKKGKFSPWQKISDEIKQAEGLVRQSKEEEQTSEAVRLNLKTLNNQLLDAKEQLDEARAALARTTALQKAEQELTRVKAIHDAYEKLTARECELRRQIDELTQQCDEATKAVDNADREIKFAQEAVNASTSDQTAAQRHIKQQACEKELLRLDANEKQAREVQRKAEMARDLRGAIESLESTINSDSAQLTEAKERAVAINKQIHVLAGLGVWQLKQEAIIRLRSAEKVASDIARWQKENDEYQMEIDNLQERLENTKLPSEEQLAEMKKLREELRVAEARLEVGLSVTLTPHQNLNVSATTDDDSPMDFQLTSDSRTIEADRLAELNIKGVAEIVIRGGKPDARELADALAVRWKKEVESALEASGMATLDELQEARTTTDRAVIRLRELRQSIKWNDDQIEQHAPSAAKVGSIQEEIATFSKQLADFDENMFVEQIAVLESCPMQDRSAAIRKLGDEQKKELEQLNVKIAGDEAGLKGKQTLRDTKLTEAKQAEDELGEPWKQAFDGAQAALARHAQTRADLETQLTTLSQEGQSELVVAQKRLDVAKTCREEALATRERRSNEREELSAKLNQCRGEITASKSLFEAADLTLAQANVEQIKAGRAELPDGDAAMTADGLDAEQKLVAKTEASVHDIQTLINNEEGALRHVGGDIARERHTSFSEALQQKHNQESEMALDYDAWQLLLKTLRGVENDEAAHLGQAIVDPVTERIVQLTGSRYGKIQLGPALETQGIVAQGETRAIDRLSVGTREQLSTILRLTLAEHLGSVLVLDDQLAQSDPQRIKWFRNMFRVSATRTQIVVLTCRPADYLLPSELVPDKEYVDSTDNLIRAANLESLVSNSQ